MTATELACILVASFTNNEGGNMVEAIFFPGMILLIAGSGVLAIVKGWA